MRMDAHYKCQRQCQHIVAAHCRRSSQWSSCSATPKQSRVARTCEKHHGREEQRPLTASSDLKGYLDWPAAEQVFKLERHFKRTADGKLTHEVVYGLTRLTAQAASPARLLELIRATGALKMACTIDATRPYAKTGVS